MFKKENKKVYKSKISCQRVKVVGWPRCYNRERMEKRNLWQTIKSGKAWMGLVKNRCKNGDYYWVDAFVTPLSKNGEVVGYESTRTLPAQRTLKYAKELYKSLNAGKKNKAKTFKFFT